MMALCKNWQQKLVGELKVKLKTAYHLVMSLVRQSLDCDQSLFGF